MHSEKVPYFILDLLQQVPSVFVRGLGRFDAIFHPAVIDLGTAQISPPFIQPDFIPQSEGVDSILPEYMHYVTGMKLQEAEKAVDEFVGIVTSHIKAAEPYSIAGFGTFSKSELDILHFTPDWDAFNLSFSGLEKIDLYPSEEKVETPVFIQSSVIQEPVKTESFISTPVEEPVKIIQESVEEDTLSEGKKEAPVFESTHDNKPAISESTTRLAWVILTSALVLITLLCAYLAWDIISDRKQMNTQYQLRPDTLIITNEFDLPVKMDTVKKNQNSETNPSVASENVTTTETNPTINTQNDKPEKVEVPKKEILIKPAPVRPSGDSCFIIVGAFSNQDNVAKMEERLHGLGYASEQIKGGALIRVAISTSCDKENLQKILSEARSSINPEAWIY